MKTKEVSKHIISWLDQYCEKAGLSGFVVGISGGIDSALTSTLCAMTGRELICISLPILQRSDEQERALAHIEDLKSRFKNVSGIEIDLTETFSKLKSDLPDKASAHELSMANSRARLRMTALYAVAQANNCLVVGTGNKIEDFGIGFYTKYGDGGVDLSPIADLTKTEVFAVAEEVGVIKDILIAKPTDGLWADARTDEDQIGASYPELEWAMDFTGDESKLDSRQLEVLAIYRRFNKANKHKMLPIPVCEIPKELK